MNVTQANFLFRHVHWHIRVTIRNDSNHRVRSLGFPLIVQLDEQRCEAIREQPSTRQSLDSSNNLFCSNYPVVDVPLFDFTVYINSNLQNIVSRVNTFSGVKQSSPLRRDYCISSNVHTDLVRHILPLFLSYCTRIFPRIAGYHNQERDGFCHDPGQTACLVIGFEKYACLVVDVDFKIHLFEYVILLLRAHPLVWRFQYDENKRFSACYDEILFLLNMILKRCTFAS